VPRALELDPYFHRPYWFRGLSHARVGDFDSAEADLKRALDLCTDRAFRQRVLGALGYCYGRTGRKRRAETLLADMTAGDHYISRFDTAEVHAGRDDSAAALTALEAAVASHESYAIFLPVWPLFHSLRAEPRFQTLLAKIGQKT
jgi:tetratricopeptide (TPR) repeat protein